MKARPWALFAALGGLLVGANAASAVTLLQLDDFQIDVDSWRSGSGNPNPPVRVADGGPLGSGDGFLQMTTTGNPAGGGTRLVAFSTTQWAGDYLGAGVTGIEMDLKNLGATDLMIRLAILGPGGSFATDAISLVTGPDWQSVAFGFAPADFIPVSGTDIDLTLGNVTQLRLQHSPQVAFSNLDPFGGVEVITATLGVDNVLAVPEPSTVLLVAAGLVALRAVRRRTVRPAADFARGLAASRPRPQFPL